MKLAFITDTHFGGKNLTGFQMQPRYVEHSVELCTALGELIRQENVDMLIHCGDISDDGTGEQIKMVQELFNKYIPVPTVLALGNHDCMQPDCGELWLTYAPDFFPQHTLDSTIIRDGVRIDVLSLLWGKGKRQWSHTDGQLIRMSDEQWARLRSGEQDLPRIIVTHCQVRPASPERTGLPEPLMIPENDFAAVGDALAAEFSPVLMVAGHIHINLLDRIGDTVAVAISSLSETPFDCKIVDITPDKVAMKTVSLNPLPGLEAAYNEKNLYVIGDESIRNFTGQIKKC